MMRSARVSRPRRNRRPKVSRQCGRPSVGPVARSETGHNARLFVLRHSPFFRHSSFVLRHSEHGGSDARSNATDALPGWLFGPLRVANAWRSGLVEFVGKPGAQRRSRGGNVARVELVRIAGRSVVSAAGGGAL